MIRTSGETISTAKVVELASMASENPGKLITIDADDLLSLCWSWADAQGGDLQTFVDNYSKE